MCAVGDFGLILLGVGSVGLLFAGGSYCYGRLKNHNRLVEPFDHLKDIEERMLKDIEKQIKEFDEDESTLILSKDDFALLEKELMNPSEPNQALVDLMKKDSPDRK